MKSHADADEQLAEMDHLYRSAPVALGLIDRNLRVLRANDLFASMHGIPASEHIGREVRTLIPNDLVGPVESLLRSVIDSGEPVLNLEMDGLRPTVPVTRMVCLVSCHPLKSASGTTRAVTIVLQDVTERKRAEEALRESQTRLSTVIDSAMDAIIVFDDQYDIRLFNAAAETLFGCPARIAVGQSFTRFASTSLREALDRRTAAFDSNGCESAYLCESENLTALRAHGDAFSIEATLAQATLQGEKLFTLIMRDVNDRRLAEEQIDRLRRENVILREQVGRRSEFRGIIGESTGIRAVIRTIERVAATNSTVLISGETGTGKELVARAIHDLSEAKDELLVTVNCAALPAGVIESELFGHEKGAFTGALARRLGRFEVANGGTIFLDEIGDLPLDLQAKLLRVLQTGAFERVGGAKTIECDVRVVAATNKDLAEAVERNEFRADLYYRLNVVPIEIPPLRDRIRDIPLLVDHFLALLGDKVNTHVEAIPAEVMSSLVAYPWPGNVRELQNVIERGIILSSRGRLEAGDWLPRASRPIDPDLQTLQQSEREHILEALQRTGWRVSGKHGAAALLDVKPTTLESRMKRLGIARPRAS